MKNTLQHLLAVFLLTSTTMAATPMPPYSMDDLLNLGEVMASPSNVVQLLIKTNNGEAQCSGTEIFTESDHKIVVTSAFCLENALSVFYLDFQPDQEIATLIDAKAYFRHPYYDEGAYQYDFAALFFPDTNVGFLQKKGPKLFLAPPETLMDLLLFHVGYGITDNNAEAKDEAAPKQAFVCSPSIQTNNILTQFAYISPEEFLNPRLPRGSLTRGDQGGGLFTVEGGDLLLVGVSSTVLRSQLKTSEWATFTEASHFNELIQDAFFVRGPLILEHMHTHENTTTFHDFTESTRITLEKIEGEPWKTLAKRVKNEAQTQFLKGRKLLNSAFDRSDELEAIGLIKQAANQKHPIALFEMATQYFEGKILPRDLYKARSLLEQSIALKYIPAFSVLAYMCRKGDGGPVDLEHAKHLLHYATTFGYPHAQHQLALMYIQGEGYKENKSEAIKWLQLAAAQGYPASLTALVKLTQADEQDWPAEDKKQKTNGTRPTSSKVARE